MTHYMKLKTLPFDKIKREKKTIELRLYDEKRRLIKEGDDIVFTCVDSGEQLVCKVVKLWRFDTFAELYSSLPLQKCGYSKEELSTASPRDMEEYYSEIEQIKYGVVGIEIMKLF